MPQAEAPTNLYDLVPYAKESHQWTHPRHLETMASLFGMQPTPIRSCRVLELGCAAGFNLIPQAIDLPDSHFLGIDLSARQIAEGQETVAALGLKNIELRQADILNVDETWGQFDYILCHGVLSWVPPDVQRKVFDICQRNLRSNGIAIVSYNLYPGWHQKKMVRELLLYHAAQFTDPREQILQSLGMLELITQSGDATGAFGRVIQEELEVLRRSNNGAYLFHEYLEESNWPFYFHEFMDQATAHGLQYLGEAEFDSMLLLKFPEKIQAALKDCPLLQQEQYMDFMRGRKFRMTMLCHQSIALQRNIHSDHMKRFCIGLGSPLKVDNLDIRTDAPAKFEFARGSLEVAHPVGKAAVAYLREIAPSYISFHELHRAALERVAGVRPAAQPDSTSTEDFLACMVLKGFMHRLFDLCLTPPRCASRADGRPLASPLARMQATQATHVINQRHQLTEISELQRQVLLRLDGKHDRPSIARGLKDAIQSGKLVAKFKDKPMKASDTVLLAGMVDETLRQLSNAALLME